MKVHSAIVFLLVFCAMAAPDYGDGAAAPSQIRATATGQTFGSEGDAVAALIDALRADNPEALRTALGPGRIR